ncbi:MAG TPA: amino acid adenylation domain-containing protein, partial [Pyrinomonadaceae bacterium]|nr:amino acid adenylation domain-containing protein [Pyrinomonadaceae bacterium]
MNQEIIEGYRLSPQQKHLWTLQQKEQGRPYSARCVLRVEGGLDPIVLEQALTGLVSRHEILRTTFHTLPGVAFPVQAISDDSTPSVVSHDLTDVNEDERAARLEELLTRESASVSDLSSAPLARFTLVKLSAVSHVLAVTLPPLCADATSLKNLAREIARSYEAALKGGELEDEPVQYLVISEWQNDLLEGEETQAGRDFWRKKLAGGVSAASLPFEREPEASSDFTPASVGFPIEARLAADLGRAATRRDATCSDIMLACWQTLLWRFTGETEITTAAACDGRTDEELADALGLLTKYLPVESPLDAETTFESVLAQVTEGAREACEWQECYGFETEDGRAVSAPYAFEFVAADAAHEAGGVQFSVNNLVAHTDAFKLKLSVLKGYGSLRAELHYDARHFDASDIERLAAQFRELLRGVAADPHAEVSRLNLVGESERRDLLVNFNDTRADYDNAHCIHELFERQAAATPDAVAVAYEETQLTYGELDARSNQLARVLRARGVGPETVVCVLMERSAEVVVGLLGVMKAGGAYLPLDPTYPRERLQFMLEDSRAALLLTQKYLSEALPDVSATVVCLDDAGIDAESAEQLDNVTTPDNAAYVIYTSGSTGKPKGVMVSHRSPVNLLRALSSAVYGRDSLSGLRASLNAPLSFDASVQQLMLLCAGATLDLIPQALRADGRSLLDYLDSRRVEAFDCTPSQLRVLLAAGLLDGNGRGPNTFLVAGEAIDSALWRELAEGSERCGKRFHNIYGPTECTVDATSRLVTTGERPSIGRPLANYEVYILDSEMNPCAVNVTGEIYVGGGGLARGYLNRAGLTAERFIAHPFSKEPGARLYRTGDTGRYTTGGNVEYVGRADNQVKLRGYRIELGEIESVLARCPGVRSTVVAVREDGGEKRLVGYVVAESESASVGDVRDFLASRLPEYMIPSAFVALDELPLNANGKVDKAALPAPDSSRRETRNAYVAPRSQTEEMVARVWAEVLKVERVGVEDNFFDLGGHSLLATQVTSRVREAFQVELPLRAFFVSP